MIIVTEMNGKICLWVFLSLAIVAVEGCLNTNDSFGSEVLEQDTLTNSVLFAGCLIRR